MQVSTKNSQEINNNISRDKYFYIMRCCNRNQEKFLTCLEKSSNTTKYPTKKQLLFSGKTSFIDIKIYLITQIVKVISAQNSFEISIFATGSSQEHKYTIPNILENTICQK